ncbi:helix-turn-helix domain-containing protein [Cohnella thailandensis]|uniref:Helix-turn-helix domain-containing protein n=1 Tax=Cohnella thailandensis TaxID=557557 RepID=A0A841T1T9_9BACL|nr:helix-turn-helix domain-containing protein [Cohnella thailandensis]MBB6636040.1 helix-turn-helix domain-containing protein [Cohnella thailandensis]MBP1976805.1 AraC-like DNA-binding protein [Cohnella thailandensis]
MENRKGKGLLLRYAHTREIGLEPDKEVRLTAEPLHRFVVCPQQNLRFRIEGENTPEMPVEAGEIVYVPAGTDFVLKVSGGLDPKAAAVSFRIEGEGGRALAEPDRPRVFRMPQIRHWLAELQIIDESSELADYCRAQSHLYSIASAYMQASSETGASEETELARFVLNARRRMLEKFDLSHEIESLAKSSGTSRFYRAFREHTGLSPHQFLTATRLKASLKLLADPGVSVTQAAHSVGYSDEFYFSRLFKKRMGLAPTEYASRARTRAAALCGVFAGDLEALGMTPCITLKKDWDLDVSRRESYLREIRQSNPDYILSGPISESLQIELSAIAPVRVYNWHKYSWKKRFAQFGELFGLTGIAEQWLADFESKSANARAHLRERFADTPFLLVGVREGNFRVYGTQVRKLADLLYDELGFQAPKAADDIGFMDASSLCEVAKLHCDHVLFLVEYPASDRYCRQLEEEWAKLKADGRPKRSFCIRLDEPFNYNAAMHEALVDQTVYHLHTKREYAQKNP